MKFLVLLLLFSVNILAQESYYQFHNNVYAKKYIVKKGDTLSEILQSHGYKGLNKISKQNRAQNPLNLVRWQNGLTLEQAENLTEGQVIYLPPSNSAGRGFASTGSEKVEDIEDLPFKEIKQEVEKISKENAGSSWF